MEIMRKYRSRHLLLVPILISLISLILCPASASSGPDFGAHPRFICTPIPVDADPACFPMGGPGVGPGHQSVPPAGWWGASDEAKATILHLRESLLQQKETILDQRETIRELTAKLSLCEGLGRGLTPHDEHHGSDPRHTGADSHHTYTDNGHYSNQQGPHGNLIPDSPHYPSMGGQRSDGGHSDHQGKDKHVRPGDITSSPEQMERMLQALKDRLDNLQKRNTSVAYSSSLKELLQRKINALEQQLRRHSSALSSHDHHDDDSTHRDDKDHHHDEHHDDRHDDRHDEHHNDDHKNDHRDSSRHTDHHDVDSDHDDYDEGNHDDDDDDDDDDDEDHHSNEADSHSYHTHTGPQTGFHSNKLQTMLSKLHLPGHSRDNSFNPEGFQISFPMRTNYMYGQVKTTLMQEIFAMTLCLWIKSGAGQTLGTPFSYSAPGQANEIVLIEWGDNPMELLIDDKALTLPLSLGDGEWHHICVTWSTRDGQWEAYQDGEQRGSGTNLSPWHPIKAGGVFILGQEQDILGGRFDATQSFVGEMSDLHLWSHVLPASDIYSLASCGSDLKGDVIAWSETEVELHGGVAKYPFDPCH
ncbi:neuronal pentraxin-1 isoform X1 [Notothenia coriiceps]|uniref:Neuronal pentraxin-1 isoform X1 n=1 Tax=Notothenia coriiceps TaxID=8208 RepID=A0A6I9PGI7_9TELE|nr:PREDICTED: neuronal pentraxin-1-like isoform X1 [Notothenia coriiceps]